MSHFQTLKVNQIHILSPFNCIPHEAWCGTVSMSYATRSSAY